MPLVVISKMLKTLSVLFVCTLGIRASSAKIIVKTNNGYVEGIAEKTYSGKTYYAYYTMPYAKPPLRELRFQAPEPSEPWKTTHNGTVENTNVCYQLNIPLPEENEDCLHINVFSPVKPSSVHNRKVPVIVNIHGGGFVYGAGLVHPVTPMGPMSPKYLIEDDIVFVAFNYRLGIFGFLSTGDTVIPGNAGLKDQIMALKWVQKNIAAFGGDPHKVTISGQSAGGASVGYLIESPAAKGLFSAGILESGTPLMPWSYQRNQTEISFKTGSLVDSRFKTSRNSKELLKVLQAADAKTISNAANNYAIWDSRQPDAAYRSEIENGFLYAPVIDVGITKIPIVPSFQYQTLKSGRNLNQVPVLMGVCSEEGLLDIGLISNTDLFKAFDSTSGYLVPQDLHINRTTNEATWNKVGKLIKQEYSPSSTFANNRLGGIHYLTDDTFFRGSTKFAEIYVKDADVYYYQFAYQGALGENEWNVGTPYPGSGNVTHIEERGYLYIGIPVGNYSQSDQLMQRRMVRLWTNFVKYHNPTPKKDALLHNTLWPKMTTRDFQYLKIGNFSQTDLTVVQGKPNAERMAFWDKIYEKYGNPPFDTY